MQMKAILDNSTDNNDKIKIFKCEESTLLGTGHLLISSRQREFSRFTLAVLSIKNP